MSRKRFCVFISWASAMFCAASACRGASLSVDYDIRGAIGPGGTNPFNPTLVIFQDRASDASSPTLSLGDTFNSGGPGVNYLTRAKATASFGNLHVVVSGSVAATTGTDFEGQGNVQASADAAWNDTLFFQSPNRPDRTEVVVHASVRFDGTLVADADATPSQLEVVNPCTPQGVCVHESMSGAGVRVDIGGSSGLSGVEVVGSRFADGTGFDQQTDLPPTIPFDIRATVGANNSFHLGLAVSGGAAAKSGELAGDSADSVFIGDIGETVAWGGISSVTDASTGEEITNWSITSDSGFDYSKPFVEVPEPPGAFLTVLGILFLQMYSARLHYHRFA